jgi:tRNA threonylcarbamoyladenosine biosynthesis protein TsaE
MDFAQKLSLEPSILDAKIALYGDLGVGKTTFTRFLLQALGVQGRIKSPTYTLVESYETFHQVQALSIWHMDFYRFNDPYEWEDAGFRDIFAAKGLKIYEWPERVSALVPEADLELRIQLNTQAQREVELRLNGALHFKAI